MASYKTIYILVEDSRETGFLRGDGITGQVCYSLKESIRAEIEADSDFVSPNGDIRVHIAQAEED